MNDTICTIKSDTIFYISFTLIPYIQGTKESRWRKCEILYCLDEHITYDNTSNGFISKFSGKSRGGTGGGAPPPRILGEKRRNHRRKKSQKGNNEKNPFPQGLGPPLKFDQKWLRWVQYNWPQGLLEASGTYSTQQKFAQVPGHNMLIIPIVDKIRSLSIIVDTNQSTNIGNR